MVKLLDWQQRWPELEEDPNPFACVVLAQLVVKQVRDAHERKVRKVELTRRLLDQGYRRADTLELLRLMDWLLQLPPELEAAYKEQVYALAEERKMPYVTSFEREGLKKGRQEGEAQLFLGLLEAQFGSTAAQQYRQQVEQADEATIRDWSIRLLRAATLEDVFTDD